jgi:hypothetical protein
MSHVGHLYFRGGENAMTEENTKKQQENKLLSPNIDTNIIKAGVNLWLLKCQISKQTFSQIGALAAETLAY